ncbi:hypothetical protein [Paenibacillus sp. NPDC057934]|uniref:hypothetical protein n=1 Tax=Paenibacillus sp. NPDC057934 TaxID=3346282 RepID=UPI0036DC678E
MVKQVSAGVILNDLENTLQLYLDSLDSISNCSFSIFNDEERQLLVSGNMDGTEFKMFNLYILENELQIHNLVAYRELRGKGIVMQMIDLTYKLSQKYDYHLFIVDMVPGFYGAMIRRGAEPIDQDSVKINKDTNLSKN